MTKNLVCRPRSTQQRLSATARSGHAPEVGPRTSVIETAMGDCSYVVNDSRHSVYGHWQVLLDRGDDADDPATIR